MKKLCLLALWLMVCCSITRAQGLVDLETGAVLGAFYNSIRIPGNGGTTFDASEGNFQTKPTWFYRIRVGYTFADRHTISLLYAPLTVRSTADALEQPIFFNGATFQSDRPLDVRYTFNSYRLTYRFDFIRKEKIRVGAGFTAKIRDAAIRLENGVQESAKTNVGFVPIVNLYLNWQFADRFGLLVEGDALAAPQGRAEDIFTGLTYRLSEKINLKAGYRLLEGGSDNDEVYNFTWFNYASAGVIWRW